MLARHTSPAATITASPKRSVRSRLGGRLAPLAAVLVIVTAFTGATSRNADAASWIVGWDGQVSVNTNAYLTAACSTTYNSDGTKTWTIEVKVNIYQFWPDQTLDTWFNLATSTGYESPTYFDRTSGPSYKMNLAYKRVHFESNRVSQTLPQRTVSVAGFFGLWENGVRYLGNPVEYASHTSTRDGWPSQWGSNLTHCVLH